MKSQIGNDAALDAKIAELFRAVDDDRAFLRAKHAEGHTGMDLARVLQQRGQSLHMAHRDLTRHEELERAEVACE